jgi:hypothetical protein
VDGVGGLVGFQDAVDAQLGGVHTTQLPQKTGQMRLGDRRLSAIGRGLRADWLFSFRSRGRRGSNVVLDRVS